MSHASDQPNDGAHFRRIGDALAAARAGRLARSERRTAACRITITVAAGNFRGTSGDATGRDLEHFPLVVDVPDLTLRGAMVMQLDAKGRATGGAVDQVIDLALPDRAAGEPRRSCRSFSPTVTRAARRATASRSRASSCGPGGATWARARYAVLGVRVRRLVIRGNRIEPGFDVPLDLRETSASIERNHISGTGPVRHLPGGTGRLQGDRQPADARAPSRASSPRLPSTVRRRCRGRADRTAGHRGAHGRDHEQRGSRPPAPRRSARASASGRSASARRTCTARATSRSATTCW